MYIPIAVVCIHDIVFACTHATNHDQNIHSVLTCCPVANLQPFCSVVHFSWKYPAAFHAHFMYHCMYHCMIEVHSDYYYSFHNVMYYHIHAGCSWECYIWHLASIFSCSCYFCIIWSRKAHDHLIYQCIGTAICVWCLPWCLTAAKDCTAWNTVSSWLNLAIAS